MINISLNDLLNAAVEVAPTAANRPADAAFTGLLDQFDRQQQAEAPAKPARARAERATTREQDDEPAKSSRRTAPTAPPKAKAVESAARDETAASDERLPAQESAAAKPATEAASQDEGAEAAAEDNAESLAVQTPIVIVAEQPAASLALNSAAAVDDGISGIAAANGATAERPAAPVADGEAEATDGKSKALAPQGFTADAAETAAADETTQPLTPAQQKAAAQAADLGKQLDNLPMQVAVQLTAEESAKPLKAAVSLANGMNHAAPSDSATATQTATAAPSVDSAAAPTAKTAETPALQTVAATQSATPAFAAMVESAADKTLPTAAKAGIGELTTIGGIAASSGTTSASATASAAAAKPASLPHPATEQVAVHIAKASAEGLDKINVKLKPATLGSVEVQIDLASDGRVHVVVSADRADTLELLQRDARGLERALNDAGLQTDQQSFSFNLRDQGTPNGNGGGDAAGRMGWHGGAEGADEPLPAVGGYLNARAAVGGVDIRV